MDLIGGILKIIGAFMMLPVFFIIYAIIGTRVRKHENKDTD